MRYQVNHAQLGEAAYRMKQHVEELQAREEEIAALIQSLRSAGNTVDLEQVIASFESGAKQQLAQHRMQFQVWEARFRMAHSIYYAGQTNCFAKAMAACNHCE